MIPAGAKIGKSTKNKPFHNEEKVDVRNSVPSAKGLSIIPITWEKN